MMNFHQLSDIKLWSRGSRDKLSTLNHHYHTVYDNQTWQGGDLPWRASTHKIASPFNHVVLQDRVTN